MDRELDDLLEGTVDDGHAAGIAVHIHRVLDGVVPVGVLDDLIDVQQHLAEDDLRLLSIALEASHEVLQHAQTVLVVHHLDEVVHDSVDDEGELILIEAGHYLLDEVRSLAIEDQLHHIVPDRLLDEVLLLPGTDQGHQGLHGMSALLIAGDLDQSWGDDLQDVHSLLGYTTLTEATEQVVCVGVDHEIRDLVLNLSDDHVQIGL